MFTLKLEFPILKNVPNFTGLTVELDLYYNVWDEIKHKNNLPNLISATLKSVDTLAFRNVYFALKLLHITFAYYN